MHNKTQQHMNRAAEQTRYERLSDVESEIKNADLLLFSRSGVTGWLISRVGRSVYSHAAKAAWWGDELFCLEVRELKGGRAVTLRSQVQKFDGLIDVYQANATGVPGYDRQKSTQWFKKICGCPYGYAALLGAAIVHLPLIRLFVTPDLDDDSFDRRPPYCSQACAMADRIGGGIDPVLNLSDRLTEPADLSRSPFYKYQCTLIK